MPGVIRHGLAVLATLLVLWGAFEVYNAHVKDRVRLKRWGAVEAGSIYRSGQLSSYRVGGALDRFGIDSIVNLMGFEARDPYQLAEAREAAARGIEMERFPLLGNGTGDIRMYADAVAKLAADVRAGRTVLVHCAAGTQRTGGAIALYRTLVQGVSGAAAFHEMQQYEWDPLDDAVMLVYLNGQMAQVAEMLVRRGVIESVPDELPWIGPARPPNAGG